MLVNSFTVEVQMNIPCTDISVFKVVTGARPQLGLGGQLKATCILVSSLNILRSSTFDVSGHYFEHTIGVRDKRDDMSRLTHHYRVFPVIIPASSRYPLLHTHCRSI